MPTRKFKPSSSKRTFKPFTSNPERNPEVELWISMERGSSQWQRTRALIRRLQPVCPCGRPGGSVHHIRDAYHHQELFYDLANLVNLCSRCHADVSQLERSGKFAEAVSLYEQYGKQNYADFVESLTS